MKSHHLQPGQRRGGMRQEDACPEDHSASGRPEHNPQSLQLWRGLLVSLRCTRGISEVRLAHLSRPTNELVTVLPAIFMR